MQEARAGKGHRLSWSVHFGAARVKTKKSQEVAELVVKYRDKGVVGFDIAGPEDGLPAV